MRRQPKLFVGRSGNLRQLPLSVESIEAGTSSHGLLSKPRTTLPRHNHSLHSLQQRQSAYVDSVHTAALLYTTARLITSRTRASSPQITHLPHFRYIIRAAPPRLASKQRLLRPSWIPCAASTQLFQNPRLRIRLRHQSSSLSFQGRRSLRDEALQDSRCRPSQDTSGWLPGLPR